MFMPVPEDNEPKKVGPSIGQLLIDSVAETINIAWNTFIVLAVAKLMGVF